MIHCYKKSASKFPSLSPKWYLIKLKYTCIMIMYINFICMTCTYIRYCLKTMSQTNDYLCSYCARTHTQIESRNALNLSLYRYVESVSKLGSRRKPICG